jgi:hypothetical protein
MKFTATDKTGGSKLPADSYKVKCTDIYPKTIQLKDGTSNDVLTFVFKVYDDEEFDGEDIEGIATMYERLGPKTKLRKWFEALLGRTLGEDEAVDTDEVLGKACKITTELNEAGYTQIAAVSPLRRQPVGAKTGGNGSGADEGERY